MKKSKFYQTPSILFIIFFFTLLINTLNSWAQSGTWIQKSNFAGSPRTTPVSFYSLQNPFVAMGVDDIDVSNEVWKYNPLSDSWNQKQDVTFLGRGGSTSFSSASNTYVGFGLTGTGVCMNDLWMYNSTTDSWTQKANCPGSPRLYPTSFSIGNRFFITTGECFSQPNNIYLNDCWEYNETNNQWVQKNNFIGVARGYPSSFVINGIAYVGCGIDSNDTFLKDFYSYNPVTDTWTQVADIPHERGGAVSFVLNNIGYVGLGDDGTFTLDDLWYFHNGTWTQATSFPGIARAAAFAFTYNNRAYVGCGEDDNVDYLNDVWEYSPDSSINSISQVNEPITNIFANKNYVDLSISTEITMPCTFSIYSPLGSKLAEYIVYEYKSTLMLNEDYNGVIFYSLNGLKNNYKNSGKLVLN